MSRWVKQIKVDSSGGIRQYTVSIDAQGIAACSCPGWAKHTPRKDCKHITYLKERGLLNNTTTAEQPQPIGAVTRIKSSLK